jgi:hypothetical protein
LNGDPAESGLMGGRVKNDCRRSVAYAVNIEGAPSNIYRAADLAKSLRIVAASNLLVYQPCGQQNAQGNEQGGEPIPIL